MQNKALVFLTEAGKDEFWATLALVVSDNKYNRRIPPILGTNLAKKCRDDCPSEDACFRGVEAG